ncbi:MAG: hypothetical protein KAG97_08240, partial [Victivallales bacterium]|nr:hypothetical protein [Victivallales bacterium]
MKTESFQEKLGSLKLKRMGDEEKAGLWIASLPVPRNAEIDRSLGDRNTWCRELGQWHDVKDPSPRRLLLVADGANESPETVRLSHNSLPSDISTPTAESTLFASSPDPFFVWERHSLRLSWEGRSIELAMGLRTGDETHWWEACRLVEVESSPTCRVVEMGGAIPLQLTTLQYMRDNPAYDNQMLHKHNWLNGQIHARLHSNGVCEIFAHHINSKFFDDGLELENAVPVIGIRTGKGSVSQVTDLCGAWDGSVGEFTFDDIHFDVRDVAPLATPEQPGSMSVADDFLVWQPYLG